MLDMNKVKKEIADGETLNQKVADLQEVRFAFRDALNNDKGDVFARLSDIITRKRDLEIKILQLADLIQCNYDEEETNLLIKLDN